MPDTPTPSMVCPKCGAPMSVGMVNLEAKSGIRGAKIEWIEAPLKEGGSDPNVFPYTDGRSFETLANYGARDVVGKRPFSDAGIEFPGWRCQACKIVAFSYPQGTDHL